MYKSKLMSNTELSIITPVLNGSTYIRAALDSVRSQMMTSLEQIVVDGGSIDGTLETLETYTDVQVVNRPGSTIYEAINEGIRASDGAFIGILNSDDWYATGTLNRISEAIANNPMSEVLSARAALVQGAPEKFTILKKWNRRSDQEISVKGATTGTPIINARFFARSLFDRIGYFDSHYKLAGDREFILRAAISGVANVVLDFDVYNYRCHPDSKTLSGERIRFMPAFEEHIHIAEENLAHVDLSEKSKFIIKDWHAYSCLAAGWRRILIGDFLQGLEHFATGFHVNPLWLFALVRHRLMCR